MWPSTFYVGAGGGVSTIRCCVQGLLGPGGAGSWKTQAIHPHVGPLSFLESKVASFCFRVFRWACLAEFISLGLEVTLAVYLDDGTVVRCLPSGGVSPCPFCCGLSSPADKVCVSAFPSCRLVTWLPDMPSDIQWLWWATSHVCSQAMVHLLPASRWVVWLCVWGPTRHPLICSGLTRHPRTVIGPCRGGRGHVPWCQRPALWEAAEPISGPSAPAGS